MTVTARRQQHRRSVVHWHRPKRPRLTPRQIYLRDEASRIRKMREMQRRRRYVRLYGRPTPTAYLLTAEDAAFVLGGKAVRR